MANRIAFISSRTSARLVYVLDWIFREQLGLDYQILNALPDQGEYALTIAYNTDEKADISIPSSSYLLSTSIAPDKLREGTWQDLPILFFSEEKGSTLPFDLFAAVFYLLSRAEEYNPARGDKYDRYPGTDSILFRMNCLERPIVDEWLYAFKEVLQHKGLSLHRRSFVFRPTYDIDIAWKYRHKGSLHKVKHFAKNLLNWSEIKEQFFVLTGARHDPFDAFDFLIDLHRECPALLFLLCAEKNGAYDKHILPEHPAMQRLVERLTETFHLALHPSFRASDQPILIVKEKAVLEQLIGLPVLRSRQHYIRFQLPQTYRDLIHFGIREDYSMGYGTHLGFRAGTSHSFFWYDLEAESETSLRLIPFCFMDTTAHFECLLSAEQAFERLFAMRSRLQDVGGVLTTIFHNFSLATDPSWSGWQQQYKLFFESSSVIN